MKQILLMIALVALVGCGKKPAEWSFAETKAKAEAGDADAQYNLGLMYVLGEGVEQDFKEAVKWYQKAADQGDADSAIQPWVDVSKRPRSGAGFQGSG